MLLHGARCLPFRERLSGGRGGFRDAVSYTHLDVYKRQGAVVSACAFARKIAIAVATWSVGQALSLIHYSAELEVQTAATNTGIYYLNAVPLIIGGILMLIVILPYNLTQEKFESILKEIDARKASSGSLG